VYYSSWWEPFQLAFAQAAEVHHALPMVQIEPRGISLAAIAAGQYDAYLRAFAQAVRSFGQPVILSFGHEMNADWYSWGYRHTTSAVFVPAWRHLTKVFAAEKATNVRWLWTVNAVGGPQVAAIKPWWPGAAYVTWVGVDGHYYQLSAGFSKLFGATLGQIRELTHDPVLVAEAGIAPYVGIAKITDLFAGAQAHG
jgi:beta-mannanase